MTTGWLPGVASPPALPPPEPRAAPRELASFTPDQRAILAVFALWWTYRPRTTIWQSLAALEIRHADGRAFTQESLRNVVHELRNAGALVAEERRDGFWRPTDVLRSAAYRQLLDNYSASALRHVVYGPHAHDRRLHGHYLAYSDTPTAIAALRLEAYTGTSLEKLSERFGSLQQTDVWPMLVDEALLAAFEPTQFERITPAWRFDLAYRGVVELCARLRPDRLPVAEWALTKLDGSKPGLPEPLRLALAQLLMLRQEEERARQALSGLDVGGSAALLACLELQAGRWEEGSTAFAAAHKRRMKETGARKRVLPVSIAWLYPYGLMAGSVHARLELARRFCAGEAGRRDPSAFDGWGMWTHAIDARLGREALDAEPFTRQCSPYAERIAELWRVLLAAWIGPEALRRAARAGAKAADADYGASATAIRDVVAACGLRWLDALVDNAQEVLRGRNARTPFFVEGPAASWRNVLHALQALGEPPRTEKDTAASRILWSIALRRDGAVSAIVPLEQKRGPRGYGTPKPVSLARLASNDKLAPWDAKVARTIRKDRYDLRRAWVDRAAAIVALIGHPAVVLAGAPAQTIELVEAMPELEVVRQGDTLSLRVNPPLRKPRSPGDEDEDEDEDDDDDPRTAGAWRDEPHGALASITVLRESATRYRVVRLSDAQRRAAQLLADPLRVPPSGESDLNAALAVLASHFEVHGEAANAAREVPPESRLRAELAHANGLLSLRIVAAPLGNDGPRLTPAAGRLRVVASVNGESVGTRRDFTAERAHLLQVVETVGLDDALQPEDACEWQIADPKAALEIVEALPNSASLAGVDWPKGKRLRVQTLDTPQVSVRVHSARDWFALVGSARFDEGLTLDFRALVEAAASGQRFVPLSDGVYAALTRRLRQQLADLAAVAEIDGEGVRLPPVAAALMDALLSDIALTADPKFVAATARLREAQSVEAAVPSSLATTLRPYQEQGFQWAMRLAAAGLGGCLADDMGLGKTIQALAVLLARGPGGAALVVAPTSVGGNWKAEARRFAPTLDVRVYGEGARDEALADAGPMRVIVVSYTLLHQAREAFAARRWHTVIADEAQAIKNVAAKRTQAAYDLDADFRLAMSGTPVENRLAELWSVMHFANPGLLGTLKRFNERFAAPIERERDRDALHRLRRLTGAFILRRTKAQVLEELPPRTELALEVVPGAEEAAHYEALRREAIDASTAILREGHPAQTSIHILAQLMRLRRAACDPRLVHPELAFTGAKVQTFAALATDLVANGHKALVFSQFVDFLTLLRRALDAAGLRYQYLDGATPAGERTRRVDAFQSGEGDLFLISLKAGGFGLNLTAADYVIVADPWWNPAAEEQAMGRAHRIGQSRPVTAYRLVTRGTIEERIVDLHRDKRALADGLLAEGEVRALPSAEELVALMR